MRRIIRPLTYKNAEIYLEELVRIKSKKSLLSKKLREQLIEEIKSGIEKGTIIKQVNDEIGIIKGSVFSPKIRISI